MQRLAVLESLRSSIEDAPAISSTALVAAPSCGETISSRIREYACDPLRSPRRHTGLTADFPKEMTSHHMDNIGESLVTSGFLLDQYFQAASRLVETRLGKPAMEPKSWHFKDHFVQYEELTRGSSKVSSIFKISLPVRTTQHRHSARGPRSHRRFFRGSPCFGRV